MAAYLSETSLTDTSIRHMSDGWWSSTPADDPPDTQLWDAPSVSFDELFLPEDPALRGGMSTAPFAEPLVAPPVQPNAAVPGQVGVGQRVSVQPNAAVPGQVGVGQRVPVQPNLAVPGQVGVGQQDPVRPEPDARAGEPWETYQPDRPYLPAASPSPRQSRSPDPSGTPALPARGGYVLPPPAEAQPPQARRQGVSDRIWQTGSQSLGDRAFLVFVAIVAFVVLRLILG